MPSPLSPAIAKTTRLETSFGGLPLLSALHFYNRRLRTTESNPSPRVTTAPQLRRPIYTPHSRPPSFNASPQLSSPRSPRNRSQVRPHVKAATGLRTNPAALRDHCRSSSRTLKMSYFRHARSVAATSRGTKGARASDRSIVCCNVHLQAAILLRSALPGASFRSLCPHDLCVESPPSCRTSSYHATRAAFLNRAAMMCVRISNSGTTLTVPPPAIQSPFAAGLFFSSSRAVGF